MAGEAQDNVWPLPSFYFKVELGSLGEIAFKEVSGLDMEAQVIEYRHGNSHEYGYPEDTFQNILRSHRVSQSDMNAICVFGGSSS